MIGIVVGLGVLTVCALGGFVALRELRLTMQEELRQQEDGTGSQGLQWNDPDDGNTLYP